MKTAIAALAALMVSFAAYAADNDFQETTKQALSAGEPAAMVKALGKQVYRGNLIVAQTLGLLLRDGLGGKPDATAAASWFEQSAEQGDAQAQLAVAQMQIKGAGNKPDPERGYLW